MIKWSKESFNSKGILQVKDKELEDFVNAQLRDYKKDYFKTIQPLDVEDFIENYLKIKIEYQKLSPNKSILGTTAISDGILPIISDEGKFEYRFYKAGTICVDIDACGNNEHLINSTLCHEASHAQFDLHIKKELLDGKTYLTDFVEIDGKILKRKSDKDWMEYHANKYMSFLLMPSNFVRKLYKEKRAEIMPGKKLGVNNRKSVWTIIYSIAKELNVSPTAMAWRLLSLKVISKRTFDSLNIKRR